MYRFIWNMKIIIDCYNQILINSRFLKIALADWQAIYNAAWKRKIGNKISG